MDILIAGGDNMKKNEQCKQEQNRKENKNLEFAKEIAVNENRKNECQRKQKDC
jgi:hypothetical protein